MVRVKLSEEQNNLEYLDAAYEYVNPYPFSWWADLSNVFDGCAFE